MENASKALIIAGAILLSILIIALGIYVFNMAKGATSTDSLSSLEVTSFNEKFTQYEGRQLGSSVKSLIGEIISNNNTQADAEERLISVDFYGSGATTANSIVVDLNNTNSTAMGQLRAKLANKHFYQVEFEYQDGTSGYIRKATIRY